MDSSLTDGVVTIRRQSLEDLELHLAGVDEEQMRWLWEPGQAELYAAMSSGERRAHQLRHLRESHDSFGPGPKWSWSVDLADSPYVAYVDCDLANGHVPAGQANISYVCFPPYRGQGYTSRAVRLLCVFLRDRTDATEAHILVDADNQASLGVARSVGAMHVATFVNEHGRTMERHVVALETGVWMDG